jgi:hypothetical protein
MRQYSQWTSGVSQNAGRTLGLVQSGLAGTTFPEDGKPHLALYSSLRRGWFFGSEDFREKLLKMLSQRPARIEKANGYHGTQLNHYAEKQARTLIRAALEHFGIDQATCEVPAKGTGAKH